MNIKLSTLFIALFSLLLILAGCSSSDQTSETDRLNEWLDQKYEEYLQMHPLQLTMLGRKDLYDQIDDMSEMAMEEELLWRAESVAEMQEEFDYDELSPEGQVSYDLWEYMNEIEQAGADFKRHQYVFDQMSSIHTQLPSSLINFHEVDSLADMEDYITRIEGLGTAIGQLIERSELQADMEIRPPKFAHEIVIRQAESLITGVPFTDGETESALWEDANRKIDGLLEAEEIDSSRADTLREETRTALLEHFEPAYESLITWIESDMEFADEAPTGVSRHPDGEAFYNYRLRQITTTDLTADEIHQIGLDEVDRIQGEMEAIKEQVGFDGTLQEFFEFVNTDDQFYYPDTDAGRQAYLDDAKTYIDSLSVELDDYFGIQPEADLVVRRVEPFREQDGAPQHYMPGTPDGSRPGVYYVHLSDMTSMPKSTMESVAYHEGIPGHHMQISIAQELESVPMFRRQEYQGVYVEGWALYSEKLAKEMGAYEDPYSDFGRLVNEIWRAIRLVVDTGIHSKGWTEEQAFNYFAENSSVAEGAIRAEVRRYMVIPGQATGYKIGMMKIGELREKAEAELGENFDIKGFHDTVLGGGSLPLNILESEVDRWIEEVQSES